MDYTVIVLIGAGVCCFVAGVAMFAKLCTAKPVDAAPKDLLDSEYADNFKECFKNTGNIEETLEELSSIYMGNQYMYNLIVNALEYIRDGQGDYETALDGINVDNTPEIIRLHSLAIRKALGGASETPSKAPELTDKSAMQSTLEQEMAKIEEKQPSGSGMENTSRTRDALPPNDEMFEEDEEDPAEDTGDWAAQEPEVSDWSGESAEEEIFEDDPEGGDDLEGFKIG